MVRIYNVWGRMLISCCVVLFFVASLPIIVCGENNQKVVKVAYFEGAHFLEGASDESVKSGYAYEVLHEISNYTGWKYEYVYGEWSDLYHMFLEGKIDIFPGLVYRDDREAYMDWPEREMDIECYSLYINANDTTCSEDNLSTLNGKRIGLVRDNNMTSEFLAWIKEHNVKPECVYYNDVSVLVPELEAGNIDGFVGTRDNTDDVHLVRNFARIAEIKSYIAVKKGATDILEELNHAMIEIEDENPSFYEELESKYYNTKVANANLTVKEQNWVVEHQRIRVGYVNNFLPFSGSDDEGKPSGVVTDIVNQICSVIKIKQDIFISYRGYQTYNDMLKGLEMGEIDAAFPVMKSVWHAEQSNIIQTQPLVFSSVSAIYDGTFESAKLDVIAVNKNAVMQKVFVFENYPNSEVIEFESQIECLEAVKNGQVGCTLYNGTRIDGALTGEYEDLKEMSLGKTIDFSIAVRKGDMELCSLLNRGIGLINTSELTNTMYEYVVRNNTYTLKHLIKDYAWVMLCIALVIIVMIIFYIMKLRQIQRHLENASQSKSRFLFNMSHDIRTPMNAIVGYTELILQNKEDKEKCIDYTRKIRSSSEFLLSLVNNVLEVARIESNKVVLDEVPSLTEQTFNEVNAVYSELMKKKNIEFTQRSDIKTKYIYEDKVKTKEILLNLVSNAYKYTPEGGSINVAIRELPCEKKGYALLETTVSDTGIGMSKEYLPKLFEEFSREQSSTYDKIQGSGLGMPIVKSLVELMGGTITVESKQGKGTTFVVTIPHRIASMEDIKKDDIVEMEHNQFVGKRILLAEDNDLNAEIAIEILKSVGFEVERAVDGIICVDMLQKAKDHYYDLILMDIQMPHMDGYKASHAIRAMENPVKRDIPIIAMTANAFEEDRKDALAAGMNGHLGKPININLLMETLASILKNKE